MKEIKVLVIVLELIAAIAGLGGLIWGVSEWEYSRTDPATSNSFIEGKKSQLVKYYNEYKGKTSEEEKKIILDIVRNEFSDLDENRIQITVIREFLVEARGY